MSWPAQSRASTSTTPSRPYGPVDLGPGDEGRFQLAVALEVNLPDVDRAVAQELADAAHRVCPYSNATRGNIDVTVSVVDD